MNNVTEIRFVTHDFPSHDRAEFIELENQNGESISLGEWEKREDGYAQLKIDLKPMMDAIDACRTFVQRVEEGTIHSSRTYSQMKKIVAEFDEKFK